MKKICVVIPSNIYAAPYYYIYENILTDLNSNFDVIIWDRDIIDEPVKGNKIALKLKDTASDGRKTKIIKYFKFAHFVKKQLKKNEYDKLIFLGTNGGTVALLSNFISKNYKNKYWLDIRDYTFEWFKPYRMAIYNAIKSSDKCTISSPAYRDFLPEHNYIQTHNIDLRSIESCKSRHRESNKKPIRIGFIGNIRYYEENLKILDVLKNDDRFIMQYYGAHSEKLEKYCYDNNITNVDFHGRFSPNETPNFYKKIDIINNIYGNGKIELCTALSNKLYYAAGLHIPILVSSNTYMEKISSEYGFGFTFDYEDKNIADKLYNWYLILDKNNCKYDEFFKKVMKEYGGFLQQIKNYIKK